jgi:hypothetical protein
MDAVATLRKAYALHLKPLIPEVAKELCYGCQVDHGSQKQHAVCTMMDYEERVAHCLLTAVARLDEMKILNLFARMMALKEPPYYMLEDTWRQHLWDSKIWREEVVAEIVQLV